MSQLFILIYLLFNVVISKEFTSTAVSDDDFKVTSLHFENTSDGTSSEIILSAGSKTDYRIESGIELSDESTTNYSTDSEVNTDIVREYSTESGKKNSTKNSTDYSIESRTELSAVSTTEYNTVSGIDSDGERRTNYSTESERELSIETTRNYTTENEKQNSTQSFPDYSTESSSVEFSVESTTDYNTVSEVEIGDESTTNYSTERESEFNTRTKRDYSTERKKIIHDKNTVDYKESRTEMSAESTTEISTETILDDSIESEIAFSDENTTYYSIESEREISIETTRDYTTESEKKISTESSSDYSTKIITKYSAESATDYNTVSEIEFGDESTTNYSTESESEFSTRTKRDYSTESKRIIHGKNPIDYKESRTEMSPESTTEISIETTLDDSTESGIAFSDENTTYYSIESEKEFSTETIRAHSTVSEKEISTKSTTDYSTKNTIEFSSESYAENITALYTSEHIRMSKDNVTVDRLEEDYATSPHFKSKDEKITSTMLYDTTEKSVTKYSSTLKYTTEYGCDEITLQLEAIDVGNDFISLKWDVNNSHCIENTSYRLAWQSIHTNNETELLSNNTKEYTLTDLDPCTSYIITLQLLSNNVNISQSSIMQTTEKKEETINISMLNLNSGTNFIEIQWNTSKTFCTNYTYNLTWSDMETTESKFLDSEVNNFTITNLEACGTYNITLQIIHKGIIMTESCMVTETTISVPGPIYNISTENQLQSINIQWQEPHISPRCVSFYVLLITRIEDDTFCNDIDINNEECIYIYLPYNSTNYTVKNVSECSGYNISIGSYTSDNQSSEVVSTKVETLIEDVSPIQNLSIYPGNENLTVSWEPPTISFCVDHYEIFYNSSKEITSSTSIIINELESCTIYNVSVVAISKNHNPSLPVFDIAETTEIALSEVEEFQLIALDMSISAKWKPPTKGSACVAGYRISSWEINEDNAQYLVTNNTETTILNLIPCGSYNVMVISISKTNKDGLPNTKNQTVLPKEFEPPLLNDKQVGKFWIQTFWKLTGLNENKCTLEEAFAQCEETFPSNLNWTIPYSNATIKLLEETDIKINVTNLSPYTSYNCSAAIINIKGMSQFSETIIVTTDPDVPSAPILLSPISHSESSFNVTWNIPVYIPGELQSFHLYIKSIKNLYPIPFDCPPYEQIQNLTKLDHDKTSYQYTNATPSSEYTIKIAASTQAGQGNFSSPESIITLPGTSSPVRINNEIIHDYHKEEYKIKVFLTWKNPCRSNGIINSFNLVINYYKFDTEINHIKEKLSPNTFGYNITNLLPETNYIVYISANIENVTQMGEENKITFTTPAGIPPKKYISNIIQPDPFGTDDPTTKAKITLFKRYFNTSMGQLLYFSLIVSQKDYEDELKYDYIKSKFDWPSMPAWKNDGEFVESYQATPIRWQPFGTSNTITYILGNESCMNNILNIKYCNGPLRSNTKYVVTVRSFTENGFRDLFTLHFETDQPVNRGMIIGIIFSILFVATVVVIGLFIRTGNYKWNAMSCVINEELNNNEPQVPQPVPVRKFCASVKKKLDEDKLSAEFQLIQEMSINAALPTLIADLPHNRIKNRYANIKPFDETRVKLLSADDELSDYINASFIRGYSNTIEYIAAQGPKQETMNDFWEMVYENNITQIIMLTNFEEKGKNKCYPYFPTRGKTTELENMTIRCTLEINLTTYVSRTIQIYKDDRKKELLHMHYTKWPDFGVPSSTEVMIQFCSLIRNQYLLNPGLIVIHCSAGVGRTGTLTALDILMQTVQANRKLDVFGTVLNLRKQRVLMVQTEDQYEYIHNCIKDYIIMNSTQKGDENMDSTSPIYENLPEIQSNKNNQYHNENISESIM